MIALPLCYTLIECTVSSFYVSDANCAAGEMWVPDGFESVASLPLFVVDEASLFDRSLDSCCPVSCDGCLFILTDACMIQSIEAVPKRCEPVF